MKALLSIAAAFFMVIDLYAQGTVVFHVPPITNLLTMMPVSGTLIRAALYYFPYTEGAPPPTTDQFVTSLPPYTASLLPGGQFGSGMRTTPNTTMPGEFAWFQVKAWETAFATSFEAAAANLEPQGGRCALLGTSNILKVMTGGGAIAPGNVNVPGFFMSPSPCPEPASVGLGLLGLAALALLRSRRKCPPNRLKDATRWPFGSEKKLQL
jgi:MYXO-CTERM domain-containing protein